jgi:hypothetical protein
MTASNATNDAERWRTAIYDYATKINAYVEQGDREGWKKNRPEPQHADLSDLLPVWRDALRRANAEGDLDTFRTAWPTTHAPLIPIFEANAQGIAEIAMLSGNEALVRVGAAYQADGRCFRITPTHATPIDDVDFFGQCAHRRFLALAIGDRILIRDGFDGPLLADLPRPRGDEDPPSGIRIGIAKDRTVLYRLQPFAEGKRVLAVTGDGVFVVDQDGIHRLLPTREHLQERQRYSVEEEEGDPSDPVSAGLGMVHGAVSPDDAFIATGHQDGRHRIFDSALNLIGEVGPHGEYPHHAAFSACGKFAVLNACHFYNGGTIAVAVDALHGIDTEFYQAHPAVTLVEDGARVYASAARGDEIYLGDANGYVRAVSITGEPRWKHFIGSTISAMALSADGATLLVATYAGFVSMIRMNAGERGPEQIGTGPHREFRRWLFWKEESHPLAW